MANNSYKPIKAFHPGETLKEKLQEMNVSCSEFSNLTAIPANIIQAVIDGEYSVSADMAIAFEQVTKIPAHFWINIQHNYDNYVLTELHTSYKLRLNKLKHIAAVF